MLAYQGLHVTGMAIVAFYLCARHWRGHVTAASRATLDYTAMMWHYTSLQGIVLTALVYFLPRWM